MPNPQVISTKPSSLFNDNVTDDRYYRIVGFTLIIVVFFGFGIWAALAPIASAARAVGKIRVETQRQTVQHLKGGIVKTIPVHDGDFVEKGQIVLTLDDTQAKSQLEIVNGLYYTALAREARLIAQRDQLNEVVYPDALHDHISDSRVREAIDVQNQIFEVRKSAYENEIALYAQKLEQLEAQLDGLDAQKKSSRHLVDSYSSELRDLKGLEKKGYAERRQVRDVSRKVVEKQGELGDFISRIASTRSEMVEAKLQSLQLQKEIQREVAAELDSVRERLFQFIEQRQALTDTLERTVIRAPQSGIVLELAVHTIGAVVREGETLMGIVPENVRLVIEAKVLPIDIDRVAIGQMADIHILAFKRRETTRILGRLINLSADSIVDERDQQQQPYYRAIVEITQDGLQQLKDKELNLIAGMPAEVLIRIGERTFLQYLTDPITNTIARSFIEE
ncbi:MAG: HlyD family type I secretion periplasmic adaptor subunit [Candidatus Thiodiazotropha sp.]|jgi:membrane fusion protein, epimerase transport system